MFCISRFLLVITTGFISFVQIQETQALIRNVLEVQPRMSSGSTGKTSDEIVFELSDNILSRLPDILDMEKISKELLEVHFKAYSVGLFEIMTASFMLELHDQQN